MVQLLLRMIMCVSDVISNVVCMCSYLTCYGRPRCTQLLCRRTAQNSSCVLHKCLSYSTKSQSLLKPIEQFRTSLRWRSSRDGVVGIATGYGLYDRGVGVRVPVGSNIFSSPCRPDRLWAPTNLLSHGYRELFPRR
jgi:hypothetical protein